MGTCEETLPPPLQRGNETNLMSQSNGTHKYTHSGDDRGEQDALAQKLETVHLEEESKEIGANVDDGDVVLDDDDDDNDVYGGVPDGDITHPYPLRPDAMDCSFYLKTGTCKFGPNCRFNHPLGKGDQFAGDKEKEVQGFYQDVGKIECKYYLSPGGCKYGDACRYIHLKAKVGTKPPELNFIGLPIRLATTSQPDSSSKFYSNASVTSPLKKAEFIPYHQQQSHVEEFPERPGLPECDYFMRTGNCKYKSACRFHHPRSRLTNSEIDGKQNFSKGANSFVHQQYQEQSEGFPERPGQPECDYFMKTGDCKFKSACRFHHPKSHIPNSANSAVGVNGLPSRHAPNPTPEHSWTLDRSANDVKRKGFKNHQQLQAEEFPERPGEPECEYYMKTGNCKYKSACRFDHPRNRMSTLSECAFSAKGLPLRPGSKICRHYEQHGTCSYGRGCLFDHPDDYSSSAHSAAAYATETPASSYPVAPPAESTAFVPAAESSTGNDYVLVPAAESSTCNDYVSDGWGDGWVM